jgi:glycosyltransferase involved in cell wall biosynthesis
MRMPTFFDPTNLPPLEALAFGCPAAVSYSMPEQANGVALLFDPTSIDELSAVLEPLWIDDALCGPVAEKGREKIERWGSAKFSGATHDILDRLQ